MARGLASPLQQFLVPYTSVGAGVQDLRTTRRDFLCWYLIIGELKTRVSEVLAQVQEGETVGR